MADPLLIEPLRGPVRATVRPPGSKSVTNRALITAALARGTTELHGALAADDTAAMVRCLRGLGVPIAQRGATLEVRGVAGVPPASGALLDAGLSGTTARFVAPVACLGDATVVLDGGEPLRRRPMGALLDALTSLGADVEPLGEAGHLPVQLRGGSVAGGDAQLSGNISSQFLSGLMLVGPCLQRGLTVRLTTELVSRPYVEMTASVMRAFGADVEVASQLVRVAPGGYEAVDAFTIEPDASAASYYFAYAAASGSTVRVEGLGADSTQGDLRFVEILASMGADVEVGTHHVEVRGTGELRGVDVDMSDCSDTAQTLAAIACLATGPTTVRGIGFIRGKETDRIAAVVTELQRLGVNASDTGDGFAIEPGPLTAATVATYDDHRMAMSFAVLGLIAGGVTIADPGCVAKTYPSFWDDLERLRNARPNGSA